MKTLLTATAFLLLSAATAFGQITVHGTGTIQAKPDVAHITVTVHSDAVLATDALANNNKSMKKVLDSLKDLGLKDEEIQTSEVSLMPQYKYKKSERPDQYGYNQPELYGYVAHNTVNVTVCDLTKTGKVFEAVVKAGSNRLEGLTFGVKDPSKLLDEAKVKAVKNARTTAELYAAAAGVKVGKLKTITESSSDSPRPPTYARKMADSTSPGETPISAGSLTFTVSVNVVYDVE